MIIADLRSSIDIGAMQQAANLSVVLRLFFSEYPEAAYVPRFGLQKENAVKSHPIVTPSSTERMSLIIRFNPFPRRGHVSRET